MKNKGYGAMTNNKKLRRACLVADLKYAKQNKDMTIGLMLGEMIAFKIMDEGYEWPDDALAEFMEMFPKFLAMYHFNKLDKKDIEGYVDEIKVRTGIDLLEPTLLTEDMTEVKEGDENNLSTM